MSIHFFSFSKRIRRIILPEQIDISTTHVHPGYTKGSSDNNIAILKLERLLDFSSDASAVCIWHGTELPNDAFKTVGFGRSDLNTEHFYEGLSTSGLVTSHPIQVT